MAFAWQKLNCSLFEVLTLLLRCPVLTFIACGICNRKYEERKSGAVYHHCRCRHDRFIIIILRLKPLPLTSSAFRIHFRPKIPPLLKVIGLPLLATSLSSLHGGPPAVCSLRLACPAQPSPFLWNFSCNVSYPSLMLNPTHSFFYLHAR